MMYALYRIGFFLAGLFPIKFSYAAASALADAYCNCSGKDRDAVRHNIRLILGDAVSEKALEDIVKKVFRNFAKYLVDFFRFPAIDADYIKKNVTFYGIENIEEGLRRGKGVILLSAHVGNWELGGAALSLSGYPVNAVVLTHQDKKINDFFMRQRENGKMKSIEIGMSLKRCYQVLKSNGLLALLGDRDFTKQGLCLDFFGKKSLIPKGPAALSNKLGSAIVPCFMLRTDDDKFKFVVEKPIYPASGADEKSAVEGLAMKYLAVIEDCIRRNPSQWFVFKNIWKIDEESLCPDTII